MGIFTRADSSVWWLFLETTRRKERTRIRVGTTVQQRQDSRRLANDLYHARMNELARRVHRLPLPATTLTFDAFATWYDAHHIVQHAGAERERQILTRLRAFFGTYGLDEITRTLVIEWRTQRCATGVTVDHFGGRRVKMPVWAQIHALLTANGPMPLADIKAAFGLSTRNVSRSYLTPKTERYFERRARGVWAAVGRPPLTRPHTYRPPSARTVNREVDLLQQILSAAVEAGHLEKSPIYGLPNLEIVQPIRRTMSEAEEAAVLAELQPDDRAILLVGLDTLARMINILDLRWSDDHGASLDIRDPKNGHSHTVPVSTRLRAALDVLSKHSRYIFPRRRRADTEGSRRSAVIKALKAACVRANVPYGRAVGGITFHWSTRRTGATRMIRRGGEKAIGVVQQIGGWKDPSVLIGIYQETITAEMVAAVESVGAETKPAIPGPFPAQAKALKFLRKRA